MPQIYLKDKTNQSISYEGITEIQLPIDEEQTSFTSFFADELLYDTVSKIFYDSGSYTIIPEDTDMKGFKQASISVISPEPVISIDDSGLITATAGKQVAKKQLTTKEGTTIVPSSSQTVIEQGTYATGNIVIAPIPDDYTSRTFQLNTWGRLGAVFVTPNYDKITIYSKLNINDYNSEIMNSTNLNYIDYLKVFAAAENSVIPDLLNNVGERILNMKDSLNEQFNTSKLYFCGVECTSTPQFSDIPDNMGAWEYVIDTLYNAFPHEEIAIENYFTNYSNSDATCLKDISFFKCSFPFTFEGNIPLCEVEYNVSNVDIEGTTYTITSAEATQENSTIIL